MLTSEDNAGFLLRSGEMRVSDDHDRPFRRMAIAHFGASRSAVSGITIACFGDHDHPPTLSSAGSRRVRGGRP
jgi:hypothetical protein